MIKKAIVLTSGGLDSTTCLAIAKSQGYECYTLSFDYGQKHRSELAAAATISRLYQAKSHRVFSLPLDGWASALTDSEIEIPDYQGTEEIPLTYVPARNTVFLSVALGWAEVLNISEIFIGVSAIDYSHYPDCRPEYIEQFEKLANLATKNAVLGNKIKIHTPLIHLSKAQTIEQGLALGVDYSKTISCYRAESHGIACGTCDSCTLRKRGFKELGVTDPTRYEHEWAI